MNMSSWDQQFEEVVRGYLTFLPAEDPLHADSSLRDLGLDSMGTVELLNALENTYDVRFVDDALSAETFATPGSLWKTLSGLVDAPA